MSVRWHMGVSLGVGMTVRRVSVGPNDDARYNSPPLKLHSVLRVRWIHVSSGSDFHSKFGLSMNICTNVKSLLMDFRTLSFGLSVSDFEFGL
jgi:hypothetical protein